MSRLKTKEEFASDAERVHGKLYDYLDVKYVNTNTKVTIICKEHGPFEVTPNAHIQGRGCPKCGTLAKQNALGSNTTEFIIKANKVHGNKYGYIKTNYINSRTKIIITCNKHGDFLQTPNAHLRGDKCGKCAGRNTTNESFEIKARNVHGNKYDYSKVVYVNNRTNITIVCPIHGEFTQTPKQHTVGKSGCKTCGYRKVAASLAGNTSAFISNAVKKHGKLYDYSLVEYVGNKMGVKIICKIHGEFTQRPNDHLNGNGCPKCSTNISKAEQDMTTWVESTVKDDVESNTRLSYTDIDGEIRKYELDVNIPSKNIAIEYNGLAFHHTHGPLYDGKNKFHKDKYYHRDKSRTLQEQHGIRIIHIWEHEWMLKPEIVKSVLRMQLDVSRRKVYGRKCELREIKVNEFKPFMESSHLQGHVNCSKYYGLYFEDELVSAMGFSKSTQGKDAEWELKRFSNKLNTVVLGGAAKLFKHFLKEFDDPSVKSFSMDRLFSGDMYKQLGFEFVKTIPPTYFYHKYNSYKNIVLRRSAQKKNLHKIIPEYIYDPNKTEVQTMNENGYFQVFDTGMSYWLKPAKEICNDDSHIEYVSSEEQAELDILLSDPECYKFGSSTDLDIEF